MINHDYYLNNANLNNKFEKQILEVGLKKNKLLNKYQNNLYYLFYPKNSDLQNLLQHLTLIKISFTLKKPFISKDEGQFHILDNKITENPIVRDKFTLLPIVKSSTWKGHLRFAAEKVDWNQEKPLIIKRLFGSEPEEEQNQLKGRLYFFPTFFKKQTDKDIITPLKRDTRTPARGPISLEVIKPENESEFYLLYFPYPTGDAFKEEDIQNDLNF
ncbi:MAG: RAMP superfamily CRISPR-associated protein [Candidatus Cloacimonetes bacterium]